MQWLRLYHDTVLDPKWRLVALDSGQPLSAVLAVWMSLLINASASSDRGMLEGWDDRVAGAAIDLRGDAVAAIRQAMQGLVLDGDRLTGWDKRQRASDNVADRVKKHRGKAPETGPGGGSAKGAGQQPKRDGNGTVTLQDSYVTLHPTNETLPPLRAQTSDLQKEEEETLCVESESSACAPAREAGLPPSAPPVFGNVVRFGGPAEPMPDAWALPDEWRRWAEGAGCQDADAAAERFAIHWLGKKDRGDRDAANSEAGWVRLWKGWINGNLKWEREHGAGRHTDCRRGHGDLASVVKSDLPVWFGNSAGSSNPW